MKLFSISFLFFLSQQCLAVGPISLPTSKAPSGGGGTPALIQTANNVSNFGMTVTTSATGSGNFLILGVDAGQNTECITSISDNSGSGGNTYTKVTGSFASGAGSSNNFAEIWYAANSKPGGTTITVAGSCAGGYVEAWFMEVSNLTGVDVVGTPITNPANNTTVSAPTVTTTTTHSVVFSIASMTGTPGSVTNSFTGLPVYNSEDSAYYFSSTIGTYGAVWSQSPTNSWIASTVAFK